MILMIYDILTRCVLSIVSLTHDALSDDDQPMKSV